jgi:uncharacterized protein
VTLAALTTQLREALGLALKRDIAHVAELLPHAPTLWWLRDADDEAPRCLNGDDAAAIPDPRGGYTLIAAEGMLPGFVSRDPYFAGFCSVMVNVSDILAMGGRPHAVVDVLFSGGSGEDTRALLAGMRDAAERFGVPIVGGHTSRAAEGGTYLAVSIVGRAEALLESRAAVSGDVLVAAVDLRGAYRGTDPFFDAATRASAAELRDRSALLPALAEAGLAHAAKDVSMAGFPGTLTMMCEASGTGARLDLDALPRPAGADLARWLVSFPSYGFLLATRAEQAPRLAAHFAPHGLACAVVGAFDDTCTVRLRQSGEEALYYDLRSAELTGFRAPERRS